MKILVVEDEQAIAQTLQHLFVSHNYAVDIAADGDVGLQMADTFDYDLILLDEILPKLDGVTLCRRLRAQGSHTPILLLEGQQKATLNGNGCANALNAGANDCVVKPLDPEDLIARTQALLRWKEGPTQKSVLTWGLLSIDQSNHTVAYGPHVLSVTLKEYVILELLLQTSGKTLSARAILNYVWPSLESPEEEAVRSHVKELRQKLTAVGGPKDLIKTNYGRGYQLNPLYSSAVVSQAADSSTQTSELQAVKKELQTVLEHLRSTQAELDQKSRELEMAYQTIAQAQNDAGSNRGENTIVARRDRTPMDQQYNEKLYCLLGENTPEQRFRNIADHAPVMIWETDSTGNCTFLSQSWYAFSGQTEAAALGFGWLEVVHPDDQARAKTLFLNAHQRQESFQFEYRLRHRDGEYCWAIDAATPWIGRDGQFKGYIGSVIDISDRKRVEDERKRAEEEHKQAERNLAFLAEITQDLAAWTSIDETMQTVGAKIGSFLNLSGCHFTEINEATDEAIITHDWHREGLPSIASDRVYRIGDFVTGQFYQEAHTQEIIVIRNTLTDPRTQYESCAALNIRSLITAPLVKDGQWQFLLGVSDIMPRDWRDDEIELIRNLTTRIWARLDRARSESALRASEEKYRSLFNSLDEGYVLVEIIYDENGKPVDLQYIDANPAAVKMTGTELVGRRTLELDPNFETQWFYACDRVSKTGVGERLEFYTAPLLAWYNFYVFKVGQSDHAPVAIVYQDVTKRKRHEANVALLAEIAENSSRLSTADKIMQVIGAKIGAFMDLPYCQFMAIDEARDEVMYLDRWNAEDWPRLPDSVRLSEQVSADFCRRVNAGETVVSNDTQVDPITNAEANASIQVMSFITVPFHKGGKWKYLFSVHDVKPRVWRDDEIELVRELANQVFPSLERARAEEALRENEQMLRMALVGAQAGTWDWEISTSNITWSDENYALYGLDPSQEPLQYDDWYKTVYPEDRERIHRTLQRTIEERLSGFQCEFRIVHPQQGTRWLLSLARLSCNEQGEPMRLSGINLDISDRKRAELALQESEQRLQMILDNSPAAIYLVDAQNNFLLANHITAALVSKMPDELVGKSIYDFWPTHVADSFAINNQTVLKTGQLLQTEEVVPHPDGQPRTFITVKFPLCNAAGVPYAICGISTDITDKKCLEAQFYRAQRLESLGTLASGIAHDLNNVFTPILTISQLLRLKSRTIDAQSQELLKVLETSAKRGTNMIKQILSFTRGTGEERSPVAIAPVLQEVIDVVQQTFPKSINICQTMPTQSLGSVLADSTYLHQVFMNLCVNARDAMPDGGTLTISGKQCFVDQAFAQAHLDAHVGNYVVVTVADTGTGIPVDVRDRIFDPFFTTKPSGQGTGLGLATVLGIVKNFGGFLQVFSELGQGTQIEVYLPAIEGPLTSPAQCQTHLTGNGELILIVDDDIAVQCSTQLLLENHHYMTLTASDGLEAIALYTQHQDHIKAVILDIMMPNMSGIALTERLKAINPTVKLIAMSGLTANRESALAAGASAFLSKPYALNTLLETLQGLITDE